MKIAVYFLCNVDHLILNIYQSVPPTLYINFELYQLRAAIDIQNCLCVSSFLLYSLAFAFVL